jgi:hypothetical protein
VDILAVLAEKPNGERLTTRLADIRELTAAKLRAYLKTGTGPALAAEQEVQDGEGGTRASAVGANLASTG